MNSDCEEGMTCDLLEECIASKDSTKHFLAGYRGFFTTEDVWDAIRTLYKKYKDAKKVRKYLRRCLVLWFTNYCIQDFKSNRKLVTEIFAFTSKKLKNKSLSSELKTLFIQKIAREQPPVPYIPPRCEAFGQHIELFHTLCSPEDVAETLDILCINYIRKLSLDTSFREGDYGTICSPFKQGITEYLSPLFDHIVCSVASHILWGTQTKIRTREYQFFIKVATELHNKANYEMAWAVYQGLIQISVQKMGRTLKKVSTSARKSLATLDNLFDAKGGYQNYAREIMSISTLYVPIFGILLRQIENVQGSSAIKIIGKILLPIVEVQNRSTKLPDSRIQSLVLQPAFSAEKLAELASLRGNSSYSEFSDSDIKSSDHELSPRSFGTPREIDQNYIPNLHISDHIRTRSSNKLRKTISFSCNNLDRKSGRNSPSSGERGSPRPVSHARIVRTMKIRNLKDMTNFWSPQKVAEWLQEIDMGEYEDEFLNSGIDGARLLNLNNKDLEKMGIETKKGKKLLEKIQEL